MRETGMLDRQRRLAKIAGLLLTALVASCGGGPNESVVAEDPVVRTIGPGEFKSATPLSSFSSSAIATAQRDAGDVDPAMPPRYAVSTYRLEYITLDASGAQIVASALMSVPVKPAGALSPVLSYQHGTATHNAEAPSNHAVAAEPSVMLASAGFFVVAPDYVGYGSSKGVPHPYLLAAPSASVVNDLLTAAQYWRQTNAVRDNKQLFLAGYSEGGYVSVAAARSLELNANPFNQNLVEVIAGGGPYQVWVALDELLKKIRASNPVVGALINPGFLKYMTDGVRASVRNELLRQLQGTDSDVTYDATLIDNYLSDNSDAIDRLSNVHDWKPSKPIHLFHGQDDETVAYLSATSTLQAMQAKGAGTLVSLTNCAAQPPSHLGCVTPFSNFLFAELKVLAKDL